MDSSELQTILTVRENELNKSSTNLYLWYKCLYYKIPKLFLFGAHIKGFWQQVMGNKRELMTLRTLTVSFS